MSLTIQKKSQKKTVKTQIVPLQHDNVQQETNVMTAKTITTFEGIDHGNENSFFK
jgi:hypothetical protein